MNVCERFGANLRLIRQKEGLTQEELSRRCQLSLTTVSRIERGVRMPGLPTIVKLADVLSSTPTSLCEGIHWQQDESPAAFRVEPVARSAAAD